MAQFSVRKHIYLTPEQVQFIDALADEMYEGKKGFAARVILNAGIEALELRDRYPPSGKGPDGRAAA